VLRAWKLECPKGSGLVFPTEKGTPQRLANIFNRVWKPVLIEAGVVNAKGEPRYNFHSLRHFYASMLIDDGANPKEVQAAMGHSSIQITYDLYGKLFKDDEADRRRKERSDRLASRLA
jgi:integrase